MASLCFKASTDNVSQAVAQELITTPIRQVLPDDRRLLGMGETFKLVVGETTIANDIPKRAAMAFSKFFNDALAKHPHSSTILLHPLEVNQCTVHVLIDFIVGNTKVKNPFGLRLPAKFAEAIDLYRHTLLFGMDHYAGGIRTAILDQINFGKSIIPYDALDELVKLPSTDRCYNAAVHCLEGLEHIGELDDDDEWLEWLNDHREFAESMDSWKTIRESRKAEKREAQRLAKWERDFPALT